MTPDIEATPFSYSSILLDKERFIEAICDMGSESDMAALKEKVSAVKEAVTSARADRKILLAAPSAASAVSLRRDVLVSELDQILEARTIERARYYLRRLGRGVEKSKTSAINDINLLRWKEYPEILTDSLWNLPRREQSGAHLGWYWGNFIPQIPHQIMLRFTKRGDWVLDPFLGSGTTLIEARRLGRNALGVELSPHVARKTARLVAQEENPYSVTTKVVTGDSRSADLQKALSRQGANRVQLVLMHPPYHDIIRFSDDDKDLSNAGSVEEFLRMLSQVVEKASGVLDRGRYLALVIGDKYSKGEWIPLGFEAMSEVLKRGFSLKSIIVKNFEETRGKRDQKQLWRYRALVGGFYIFKHEYIFLFKKR